MGFLYISLSFCVSVCLSFPTPLNVVPSAKDNTVQSPHERNPLAVDFSALKTVSQTNFGSLYISLSAILLHQRTPEEAWTISPLPPFKRQGLRLLVLPPAS